MTKQTNSMNSETFVDNLKNGKNFKHEIGYALLVTSSSIFLGFEYFGFRSRESFPLMAFFFHYLIALSYLVFLLASGSLGFKKSWNKENIHKTVILFYLFFISAYAFNRILPVFQESVSWFCWYLCITTLVVLTLRFFEKLPKWINKLQYAILGSSIVLYIYLSLFVVEFYIAGSLGIIFLGLGYHIFIPLILLVCCIFLIKHTFNTKISYYWIVLGFTITIGLIAIFTWDYTNRVFDIESKSNLSVISENEGLPTWASIGKYLKNDWITERILKSDLVYTTAKKKFGTWNFMPNVVSWDEIKKHDPLVFIASIFADCSLTSLEKVQIIQSISDARHQSGVRLWSGDNLSTSYIISDIDIYSDLRIAYTEKYITIKNNAEKGRWWGNTQEAIYTFQLPEGSIITSLSLWINGIEKKGILTSKQKAVKAYKTIVGIEQRDPSVVHWQEGNTVSVRIFPCTPEEQRKFKIGITSPLSESNGKVFYKNIKFKGPDPDNAKETIRIRFLGSTEGISIPNAFQKDKKGFFHITQSYNPDFQFSFSTKAIVPNTFSYAGYTYTVREYKPELKSLDIKRIYLDINNAWSEKDLSDLLGLTEEYKVYVYWEGGFLQLNKENWHHITNDMSKLNFSLFPFHQLKNLTNSLVITQGKTFSPHLSDIKNSLFEADAKSFFAKNPIVNVYNLGDRLSTYVSSLRELRVLNYAQGDIVLLRKYLADKSFPVSSESSEKVIIQEAKMAIEKIKTQKGKEKSNAPDHLARLFFYSDILRKFGYNYFNENHDNSMLVKEASSAYVVSPVSSLIVLETQEDYDRFGIKDNKNSLKNASKESTGAVPEPHEWVLFILFLLFVIIFVKKSKLCLHF